MPYLVDGNNLAHALRLSAGGQADRNACVKIVQAFCRSHGSQATIVFDGPGRESPDPATPGHRLTILFSEKRSADDTILRLLSGAKGPRDFTVVTSDKSLGDKSRHLGAKVERAHEFARRLDRRGSASQGESEKPSGPQTPDEIEAWLRVFGGTPSREKP